jgi:hypothetical protein
LICFGFKAARIVSSGRLLFGLGFTQGNEKMVLNYNGTRYSVGTAKLRSSAKRYWGKTEIQFDIIASLGGRPVRLMVDSVECRDVDHKKRCDSNWLHFSTEQKQKLVENSKKVDEIVKKMQKFVDEFNRPV